MTEFDLDLTTPRDGGDGDDVDTGGDRDHLGADADGVTPDSEVDAGDVADDKDDIEPDTETDGVDADPFPADVDAVDDDEVEPVELLVQLAKEGEIDPWDIDIVHVTDAFLDRLDEVDLRTSGRALFYASVLLRMKSDELLEPTEPDDPEPEPWEVTMEGGDPDPDFDPISALDAELDRRLDRKHARGSPETLDELVRELREAERGSWWKESRSYDTSESPRGFSRGTQTLDYRAADDFREGGEPTEGDVTGTTHTEDIEAVIADVEAELRRHYDAGRKEVLFREVRKSGGSVVETFLAALFLANRGTVRLQQDDIFGDLWIRDPSAPAAGDEAVAD